MPELLVQQYLRSGKTLDALKFEHGINYRILNDKISLTYDMIESKESDAVACECRGLVLRESTYDIVHFPFKRFFNLGQNEAATIDWDSAEFISKLDGTLCIVGWDDVQSKWCVATRSMPEAGGNVNSIDMTFAELFDHAVAQIYEPIIGESKSLNIQGLMNGGNKYYTYMFELVSPFNRIVCKYDNPKLYLLGVRNITTHQELNPKDFSFLNFNIKQPQTYSFNNLDDMFSIIKDWNPLEHEGLVVRDKYFNRIKVKTPAYLAAAHIRDSVVASTRSCVEVILLGKEDDVMTLIPPQIGERIMKLKAAIRQIIIDTQAEYDRLKDIENIKEFALEAQKYHYSAPLFAIRRNKAVDVRSFIDGHLKENKFADSFLDHLYDMAKKIDSSII